MEFDWMDIGKDFWELDEDLLPTGMGGLVFRASDGMYVGMVKERDPVTNKVVRLRSAGREASALIAQMAVEEALADLYEQWQAEAAAEQRLYEQELGL